MPESAQTDEFSLSTMYVVNKTGLTYRQVDYWTTCGVFDGYCTVGEGSGVPRWWKPEVMPIMLVLKDFTMSMRTAVDRGGRSTSTTLLREIVQAYHTGELVLGDRVKLVWIVE